MKLPCEQANTLTGPRFDRAMFRQARRVPNDKGSSLSTAGELNPRESKGGNSSRSIPCKKVEKTNIVTSKLVKYSLSYSKSQYPGCYLIDENSTNVWR